jgi:DNA-binding transcriptional LysR family regulator
MISSMELRHLRCFAVVGDEQSCGRAALRLGVSQPAVSMLVQRLERELGIQLLERSSRGSHLTVQGRALHARIKKILEDVDALRITGSSPGDSVLRVGYTSFSASVPLFTHALDMFRTAYPKTELKLVEMMRVAQPVQALRSGQIDVAFAYNPPFKDGWPISRLILPNERVLVALSTSHRLAQRRSIELAQLRREPFVLHRRDVSPKYHEFILAACRAAGFTPKVFAECSSWTDQLRYVAANKAVALVARGNVPHGDSVVFRPLERDPVSVGFELLWRKDDSSPEVHRLLEQVKRAMRTVSSKAAPGMPPSHALVA